MRVNRRHQFNFKTMNIKEKFGEKVKTMREQKSISIEHLANISNVDRNYISDIEKVVLHLINRTNLTQITH